jgi:acetyl esterase/lipase
VAAPAVHRYGPGPEQWGELWLPDPGAGGAPPPLAVLVHGGFWRAPRTCALLRPLAAALARDGWAAWNLEYRRVGQPGAGWPGTCEDVAAGVHAVAGLAGAHRLDLDRVLLVGHSAGGQLALLAAARPGAASRARAVVSLAGVVDLVDGARAGIGEGAVAAFLGATPDQAPERYAAASPLARLPLGLRQLLVHGDADPRVPVDQSRRYVAAATAAGDPAELLELPGVDHMALIDPTSPAWRRVAARLLDLLAT